MANTYSQIHVHLVFAAKARYPQLTNQHQKQIHAYLAGKAKENECYINAIGGTDDHIHILININPKYSISDIAKILKGSSSHYINEKKISYTHFEWQTGYGAFSVSQSNLSKVIDYIRSQAEHHRKLSFMDEYVSLLDKYKISYEKPYLFEPV